MQALNQDLLNRLENLMTLAKQKGADAADAVYIRSISENIEVRKQKLEAAESADNRTIGLRIIYNGRQATSSLSDDGLWNPQDIVDEITARAKILPKDPYAIVAPNGLSNLKDLDLYDNSIISSEKLKETALKTENFALENKAINNSLGASASASLSEIALINSFGFYGYYKRSSFSKSVSVLAGEGLQMERDYAYDHKIFWDDLKTNKNIGYEATERTLRRLNPQIPRTGSYKVIFDPRVSRSLIHTLTNAINGSSIIQKNSFLQEKMGETILPTCLNLIDNPLLKRGLASRPFDADGYLSRKNIFIEDGFLKSWILDERSALELGLKSTASAVRNAGSLPLPAPSNIALIGGNIPLKQLMKDCSGGLYITNVMGMGVQLLTGDYSQGASGFIIDKNGNLSQAVHNFTIAGHLLDMLKNIIAADDIDYSYATAAPTLSVGELTIAGK